MSALAYEYESDKYEAYELINGEVYMMARPSINHARIAKNIVGLFDRYLKGKRCEAFGEVDVHLSEGNDFIPDVIIVCNPEIIEENRINGAPDLVVEIISPRTARIDRTKKFELYAKHGVKEYWIVDPKSKIVEAYHLVDGKYELDKVGFPYTEKRLNELDEKERAAAVEQLKIKVSLYEDFVIDVADVFEDVD